MLEIGGTGEKRGGGDGAAPPAESVRPTSWVAIFTIPSTQVWSTRYRCGKTRPGAGARWSFPAAADAEPMTLVLGDPALAHSHQRFIQRGVQGSCNAGGRRRAAATRRPQRCDHVVVGRRIRFFVGRGGSCQFSDLLRADEVNRSTLPP